MGSNRDEGVLHSSIAHLRQRAIAGNGSMSTKKSLEATSRMIKTIRIQKSAPW